jgi:hypothetical protein
MTLCDYEACWICANVLIFGGGHPDFLRTHRIRTLAQEVIRRVFLAEAVGDFTDPFVHVPENRLVQRKTFLLCSLHWPIDPNERTAAAAYTNTARYVTRPIAPLLAGLALRSALGAPFVIAGALKSAYDVGLYTLFRNVDVENERPAQSATAG